MQRDRKYSKYIHVLLYLKDKGNIWAPIRLKKRKKNREKLNNHRSESKQWFSKITPLQKKKYVTIFYTREKTINPKKNYSIFHNKISILSRNKKPSHKNLNYPKHLSPSFSLSLPYTNPLGGPSRIFLPSTEERRELSFSLSLSPSRLIERRARVNLIRGK